MTRASPQVKLLRRDYPDCLLEADVADKVGRSHSTVRRWRRSGALTPTYYVDQGKTRIWLYTKDDVRQAKKLAASIKPGRKRKNAA